RTRVILSEAKRSRRIPLLYLKDCASGSLDFARDDGIRFLFSSHPDSPRLSLAMQKTMPAIVKAKAELGLRLEQVPMPEVGSDDVLIRTKKASICGTDVHISN